MLAILLALPLVGPPELGRGDGGVELAWRAVPGCPDEAAVRERLAAAAGDAAAVRVDAQVERREGGSWSLRLEIDGPAGRGAREITATSCHALVDSAAAVVGIVARSPAADAAVEPVPSPPAVAPEEPAAIELLPPRTPAAIPATTPVPSLRPGWIARVGADVDVGLLPSFGATLGGSVGPSWRRARVVLGALHAIDRERVERSVHGSFALTAGRIAAGPVLRRRALVLAGEAGVELGAVRAHGGGVPITHVRRHLWIAAAAGVEIAWAFAGAWRLGAQATAVVPMRRWAFAIGGDGLGEIGRIGGRFGVSLGYEGGRALRNSGAGGQP